MQVFTIFLAVYKHFMEAIDAIDNGEGPFCTAPWLLPRCTQAAHNPQSLRADQSLQMHTGVHPQSRAHSCMIS